MQRGSNFVYKSRMEMSLFNMMFFAYGSMISLTELENRRVYLVFETVAKLPKHSLRFTRFSKNRSCEVADAVESQSEDVCGVVDSLTENNRPFWTGSRDSIQDVRCISIRTFGMSASSTALASPTNRFRSNCT